MTLALQRHRLVRLSPAGWAGALGQAKDAQAREILRHWSGNNLPLVVVRQEPALAGDGLVALGLPAPLRWRRRRLGVRVAPDAIGGQGEFPQLDRILPLLASEAQRQALRQLHAELLQAGALAHVYGSHGWQALTGLEYLRPGSDLDLWVAVRAASHADVVAELLAACPEEPLRIDGELVFSDGNAVAWREWQAWRAGRTRAVMSKHLHGLALHTDSAWCAAEAQEAMPCAL